MLLTVFSRLVVRLLALCLLLCALVSVFGGRQPSADEAWQRFGLTACALPCFAGITPGQTSFNQAQLMLMRHVPSVDPRMITSGASINFLAHIQSQQMIGLVRYDQGLVGEIHLSAALPVAQVIAQLGTPDCILPNSSSAADNETVIFWLRGQVSVAAVLAPDERSLNLNADALALWLSADATNDCSLRGALPWRGFAPMWAYER